MTATTSPQRSARPIERDGATHQFAIGQTVRLRGGFGATSSRHGDVYKITGKLPPLGNSAQYRIRNEGEQHERVATEDSLEAVAVVKMGEGAALRARTFGNV